MVASSYPQNLYSSFPEPLKEKSLLEKTMEFVLESERQIQNMFDFHYLPNFHMTQESCHFRNQDSISSYQSKLDQNQILDILTSYPFLEIELKDECEPALQFSDSSPILESILTRVLLPELSNILEPVLIPIILEVESTISPIHIPSVNKNQDSILFHPFELAQYFENHIDILASYPFFEIELEYDVILEK